MFAVTVENFFLLSPFLEKKHEEGLIQIFLKNSELDA
jgi:hypothetical protein